MNSSQVLNLYSEIRGCVPLWLVTRVPDCKATQEGNLTHLFDVAIGEFSPYEFECSAQPPQVFTSDKTSRTNFNTVEVTFKTIVDYFSLKRLIPFKFSSVSLRNIGFKWNGELKYMYGFIIIVD